MGFFTRFFLIPLSQFPSAQGFAIEGVTAGDQVGISVSGTGDVNGDGIPDLLIDAPGVDRNAGAAYVIYGQKQTTTVSPIHSEQESSTDILYAVKEQFNHFYQQGKEYLSSFWKTSVEAEKPELSAEEQARLRKLLKMQITVEQLVSVLDTSNDENSLKKVLKFYHEKIVHWQETVRELSAQDIFDLQEDIMKLRWRVYGIDDMVSMEALTQSKARDAMGFFRPMNISGEMAPMMLAAQANRMLP